MRRDDYRELLMVLAAMAIVLAAALMTAALLRGD
jgi:hypothetical protein